jgi:hypothetical protein
VSEEQLKRLDEVVQADERAALFSLVEPATGTPRPLALADLHVRAVAIELHEGVPEAIRSHFATAKNLLVYAWFYYPFTVTAHFMSMVSIEYALRIRYEPGRSVSFKDLVRRAVREGLVRDEGFAHVATRANDVHQTEQRRLPTVPADVDDVSGEPKRYVDDLIDALPSLRNTYAHGRHTVRPFSSLSVQIAADFINQLYPRPEPDGP